MLIMRYSLNNLPNEINKIEYGFEILKPFRYGYANSYRPFLHKETLQYPNYHTEEIKKTNFLLSVLWNTQKELNPNLDKIYRKDVKKFRQLLLPLFRLMKKDFLERYSNEFGIKNICNFIVTDFGFYFDINFKSHDAEMAFLLMHNNEETNFHTIDTQIIINSDSNGSA